MHLPIPPTLGAVLALAIAAPAAAQQPDAVAAIGACYARCVDDAQRSGIALTAKFDRFTDLLISDEYHALTDAAQDDLVAVEEHSICAAAQSHVRSIDACNAACIDAERAHRTRAASSRARFQRILRNESAPLRDAGLWSDFRTSPVAGAAFDRACDSYWNYDSAAYGRADSRAAARALRAAARRGGIAR